MKYPKGSTPKAKKADVVGTMAGAILALAVLVQLGFTALLGWGIYELVHWLVTTK